MKPIANLTSLFGFAALASMIALNASSQTLVHRYSFSDPAGSTTFNDSIGGTNFAGVLDNDEAPGASAILDGSQLQLDGTGGYGKLPAGMISTNTQVTFEFWASYKVNQVWTRTFSFGDQNGSGQANTTIDFTHMAAGNYENLNVISAASSGYANNAGGLDGQTNVHVTVVVDPVNNKGFYYNGSSVRSSGFNGGPVPPLNTINDIFGLLGRSLFDLDPKLNGSIDEFRIYSGVVSAPQVVLNDAAGPNTLVTNSGALSTVSLTSPSSTLTLGGSMQLAFKGNFANVSNVDLIAYGNITGSAPNFSSGNTNVFSVNATNGQLQALSAGSTTITATYGGKSANVTISAVSLPAVLAHRYSFTTDASDSIGGANGTLNGSASVSGGQVIMNGNGDYVSFPGNVINIATNSAITIETWATYGGGMTWSRVWEFGAGNNNNNNLYQAAQVPNGNIFTSWPVLENFGAGSQPIVMGLTPLTNLTMHTTAVINPATSTLTVYTNGNLYYSRYDASASLSAISTNSATLGFSSAGDPTWTGSIDEYRIYSGALTGPEAFLSHANGTGSTNRSPGALQSIVMVATNYPAYAGEVAPVVLANYANLSNYSLLPTLTASVLGLTVTSGDTNIVVVLPNNMLQTVRPGQVAVTASYQGFTNRAIITVQNTAKLTHRYSFTTDASDSVGTANGTLNGGAVVVSNAVQLDSATTTYVDLPPGLISTYKAVTIDAWATFNNTPNWARLWFFGDDRANEFYFAPVVNGSSAHRYSTGFIMDGFNVDAAPQFPTNAVHVTCILGDGSIEVWTNGVLQTQDSTYLGTVQEVGTTYSRIGFSPYADPGCASAVDEFRIYNGRLSPLEIQASDILGPNQTLSVTATLHAALSGGNLVLSWPVADASFTVQTKPTLTGGTWTTLTNTPTLVGNTSYQITIPNAGGSQYFRLWH